MQIEIEFSLSLFEDSRYFDWTRLALILFDFGTAVSLRKQP